MYDFIICYNIFTFALHIIIYGTYPNGKCMINCFKLIMSTLLKIVQYASVCIRSNYLASQKLDIVRQASGVIVSFLKNAIAFGILELAALEARPSKFVHQSSSIKARPSVVVSVQVDCHLFEIHESVTSRAHLLLRNR